METEKAVEDVEEEEQFKSYYVVWKPEVATTAPGTFTGLNRTMQYGNF